jgi:uncharacterized protein YutE (UPF0331/DUF86 family)
LVGNLNLISPELATALLPSATFRNLLTHAYDDILLNESYEMMQLSFVHYPEYIHQVERYIFSRGNENE